MVLDDDNAMVALQISNKCADNETHDVVGRGHWTWSLYLFSLMEHSLSELTRKIRRLSLLLGNPTRNYCNLTFVWPWTSQMLILMIFRAGPVWRTFSGLQPHIHVMSSSINQNRICNFRFVSSNILQKGREKVYRNRWRYESETISWTAELLAKTAQFITKQSLYPVWCLIRTGNVKHMVR